MGIKQLYIDNLWKLPNEYGDVSVMTGADEWLSFRRFTSNLSWTWKKIQFMHYKYFCFWFITESLKMYLFLYLFILF